MVDDFSELPVEDIADAEQVALDREQRARDKAKLDILKTISPQAMGQGRKILDLSDQGRSIKRIADLTDLEPEEVKAVVDAPKAMPTYQQRQDVKATVRNSVFDMEARLQELFDNVNGLLELSEHKHEMRLGAASEIRQLLKLAKDTMKDAAFIDEIKRKHQNEIESVLRAFDRVAPDVGKVLRADIEEQRAQRKALGGE
jgi:hypothetical protein